jgi:hypothetical protein
MLQKYLQQIQAGKAVNYQKLLALLPPAFYQQRAKLFKVKASGAGKWQVSIADAQLFAALMQSAEAPADRVTASWQGDSHQALTSHSYVLVYHPAQWAGGSSAEPAAPSATMGAPALPAGAPPEDDASLLTPAELAALLSAAELPAAALSATAPAGSTVAPLPAGHGLLRPELVLAGTAPSGQLQLSQGFVSQKTLLLIENEENFFRFREVLALCSQMLADTLTPAQTDVALAAGSRIGSALLSPFLQQYTQVWCAFDFDAAGLEIFDHLHKRYGDKVRLVCPPDLTPWLEHFRAQAKPAQLDKAVQLADHHRLYGLSQALLTRKLFLEQEVLLQQAILPTA